MVELAGRPGRSAFASLAQQAGVTLERVIAAAEENRLLDIVNMIRPSPAQARRRLEEHRQRWADETRPALSAMLRTPQEEARLRTLTLAAKRWPQ